MKAYKLFRVLKNGEITPLFINKTLRLPHNTWLDAEPHETKGFKFRPGWHCTSKPIAPHLSEKGRRWYEVEIEDYTDINRPKSQGGLWFLANRMRIIKAVDMKETNTLKQVKEFHKIFGAPVLDSPTIPNETRSTLRVNLLQEELNELKEAIKNNDLVEVADALADLQYVLTGAVLEFGLGGVFKDLNDEVHRSNMSKTCESLEVALKTANHYIERDGSTSFIKEIEDGKYVVLRGSDNKVLKSVNYSEANLKGIIDGK